jgi:dTDP-glucose 4,6-dehydratase
MVGEVYNIGGHNEKTNLEVVKLILKHLKKPESLISYVTDRAGHDLRYAIDPTKITKALGWTPKTKFEDGIKLTIDWYLRNQSWTQSVLSGEYQSFFENHYGHK